MKMIKFKLCKKYNSVEVEYESVDKIELAQLEAIYGILPEYVDIDAEKTEKPKKEKKKPSEAQIKFAQKLGIDPGDMDMEELRVAIKKATEKA